MELKEITDKNVIELVSKLDLKLSTNSKDKTGSHPLELNSKKNYEKHYRGLKYFFSLIGRYSSLLMLLDTVPEPFCPSMEPEAIALFIKYKRGEMDEVLQDLSGNSVFDVFGNLVRCDGKWKDPKNVDQLLSAIGAIHSANGQRGTFIDTCVECVNLESQKNYHGCRFHRGSPLIWRKGNPKDCDLIMNVVNQNSKDGSTYLSRGDSPLTPWELLDIRQKLLSSNSLSDLQVWLMILLACRMFLRHEELASLKFESFNKDISIVKPDCNVEALAIQVFGKSDRAPVILQIWRDDINPELCPIKHLLVYVYLLGASSGYLFPKKEEFHKGGECTTFMSYDSFQSIFQGLCKGLIPRDGPFGSHSCRKTAYLLAIWGNGNIGDIMMGARHKTIAHSMTYQRDAKFLLAIAEKNGLKLPVSNWKPIFCKDLQLGRSINSASLENFTSLWCLSSDFVSKTLRISNGHPLFSVKFLIEEAIKYSSPTSTREKINEILSTMESTKAQELSGLVEKYALEFKLKNQRENVPQVVGNVSNDVVVDVEENRQRRVRGGENKLEIREKLRKMKTGIEKINCCLEIKAMLMGESENLTEGARNFVHQCLNPIVHCFQNHFNGDKEGFVRKWGAFSHSTFKKKCCKGLGDCCG